ncbi:MAG: hypothetical protein WCT52_01700 [Candidatus Micrarchaeia archaeon]
MDFRLWKKPEGNKKSPLLEIICPRAHNLKFPEMEVAIKKAVGHAKRKMDSDGAPAAAILFSEGENFRFTITQEEGAIYAERVQKLLPNGYFISVAFNLLESSEPDGGYNGCNNGYLVSREQVLHSPKRNLTTFEKDVVGNILLPEFQKNWEARTRELEEKGELFGSIDFGFDQRMEHRICADVCQSPIYFEPQTITLVSAGGNQVSYYNRLAGNRMAVVTNDSTKPEPVVYKREGTVWGIKALEGFHMLSVFENPANPQL